MSKMKLIVLGLFFSIVISCGPVVMTALAGSLDAPAAPSDPASAMYTLEDIYNRLNDGKAIAKRTGGFEEPTSGPGSTGYTLDEVAAVAWPRALAPRVNKTGQKQCWDQSGTPLSSCSGTG